MRYAVTSIKSVEPSIDGDTITLDCVTEFGGDLQITMPASLLDMLQPAKPPAHLNSVAVDAVGEPGQKAVTSKGTLRKPKKWILGAETTKHKIVALIFDPQTKAEVGFALSPKSAQDLAAGLTKSAETVITHKPSPPN